MAKGGGEAGGGGRSTKRTSFPAVFIVCVDLILMTTRVACVAKKGNTNL